MPSPTLVGCYIQRFIGKKYYPKSQPDNFKTTTKFCLNQDVYKHACTLEQNSSLKCKMIMD